MDAGWRPQLARQAGGCSIADNLQQSGRLGRCVQVAWAGRQEAPLARGGCGAHSPTWRLHAL